jgi:hypothetical protein
VDWKASPIIGNEGSCVMSGLSFEIISCVSLTVGDVDGDTSAGAAGACSASSQPLLASDTHCCVIFCRAVVTRG